MTSARRMMDSAILNMSPARAVPFRPRRSGDKVIHKFSRDVLIEADTEADLRACYDRVVSGWAAVPMPIWC